MKQYQQSFVGIIRQAATKRNISPAYLVQDIINEQGADISHESAKNKLSGRSRFSLDEAFILAKHLNISIDAILSPDHAPGAPFRYRSTEAESFSIAQYFEKLQAHFDFVEGPTEDLQDYEIIYITNDIPLFQLFHHPELMLFKFFFWQKSSLGLSNFSQRGFSLKDIDEQAIKQAENLFGRYRSFDSIEIISSECLNSMMQQIWFYLSMNQFDVPEDALVLCDKMKALLTHLEKQAETSSKSTLSSDGSPTDGAYQLYVNDMFVLDGLILSHKSFMQQGSAVHKYLSFLTTSPLNYLFTEDPGFYASQRTWATQLMKACKQLHGPSMINRQPFFKSSMEKIDVFQQKVEHWLASKS